jgi:hypothetical protein
MVHAGFASPAFLPIGIYQHDSHSLHAPRFFTSFRMTIPTGRLHGAFLPSFPAPMTPMQHRLPVISSGGQRKNDEIVS